MFIIYRSETATTPLKATWEKADARLREAIVEAAHRLNRQLGEEPHQQGESREGGTRILFDAPLGVLYEVDDVKRIVRVLRTWAYH